MTFFHDLNKRLAQLAEKQTLAEGAVAEAGYSAKAARAGKDIGKPGKNFSKIAADAGKRYGSKAAGERVAGAVLNKLRHPKEDIENEGAGVMHFKADKAKAAGEKTFKMGDKTFPVQEGQCAKCAPAPCSCDTMEESALQAYLGDKKYGKKGMDALRKAGREHASEKKKQNIRAKFSKKEEPIDEADLDEVSRGEWIKQQDTKAEKSGKKKFNALGQTFDTDEIDEGFKEMDAWLASREKEKGTGKFDRKERTLPGGMKATTYTRRHDDEEESDDEVKSDEPKKKGRPKSAKSKDSERVTKGSHKYKTVDGKRVKKEKTKEALDSDGVMMTRPSSMSSEGIDPGERGEYDDEAGMTKDSLHTIVRHARELEKCLRQNENLPEWVQEKVGQIKGMMSSVTDYILSTHERDAEQHLGREGITIEPVAEDSNLGDYRLTLTGPQAAILLTALIGSPESKYYKKYVHPITAQLIGQGVTAGYDKRTLKQFGPSQQGVAEKAVSKAQRKFMGMAHAIQKGEKIKGASPELKKVAKTMKPTDTHDFAVTKEKDLPKKVKEGGKPDFLDLDKDGNKKEPMKQAAKQAKGKKEEKVDETTVAGSVAPVANAAPKGKGGMQFGKGVYESYNKQFTTALNESISIESKMQECGDGNMEPGITITADGEEAAKLMMLLKLAGLESQLPKACPTCGASPCGCDQMVDENAPDWPTNTEKLAADPNLRTYSGGLNGPKSTGQSTTPVLASQLRRQASMEESVALERNLFKTWQNYKG
jgi:hypothetical protein